MSFLEGNFSAVQVGHFPRAFFFFGNARFITIVLEEGLTWGAREIGGRGENLSFP